MDCAVVAMPNRIEREIEEILTKLDDVPERGRAPIRMRRGWRSRLSRSLGRLRGRVPALPALNPGTMMLVGIVMILSGLILRTFSGDLTRWVVTIGLVLFFLSFILSFWPGARRGGAVGGDTYWRGQRIPRSQLRGPSLSSRLTTWWQRRNRRR